MNTPVTRQFTRGATAATSCHDEKVFFKLFNRVSGPAGDDGDTDMRTNSDNGANQSKFRVTAPAGEEALIYRLNFLIMDTNPAVGKFGAINALANGCLFRVVDYQGAVLKDFLDGATIKKNNDFVLLAGVDVLKTSGTDMVDVRWTISAGLGGPLRLEDGQSFEIVIQDDIRNLDEFRVMVQGRLA